MSVSQPRTIILFMVDQLAAKWLEVARQGIVDLPNFDALQAEGVTFNSAFSTNPVCSPSRASIATGMSAAAHGVGECGYELDPSVPTFMQALQSHGWRTGAFGKLHFLPQIKEVAPDYHPYGFDVVHNSEDTRAGAWLDWVRVSHPEHYTAAQSTVWMTMVPELEAYGSQGEDLRTQILQAQEQYPESVSEAYALPFPAAVSQTAWITDRACEFLEQETGSDLFAQISYVQPHNPFTPPPEYVDRVHVATIPAPVPAEWQADPIPYYQQERYREPSYDTTDWQRQRQLYFADLAHLDYELGRVRATLQRSGRLDQTLFVFTSDHGELLHDHGLVGKWERHYDPCVRVPMIVQAPGCQPSKRTELTEHTDIAATIYDWADVPPPELPTRAYGQVTGTFMLHGRSLVGLISGKQQEDWRESVYIQSNNSHMDPSLKSWARTVRTSRYRYTRHLADGGEQLFDLERDPDEQHNLAGNDESREVHSQLQDLLCESVARDGYPTSPRQLYQIGSW